MIANTTRVQVPTGEKATVIEIAETAVGTTALVRFDESGVTATGTARFNVADLQVIRGVETTTKPKRVHHLDEPSTMVVVRHGGNLSTRWVFAKGDSGVITVRRIKGGFARVEVLEAEREISSEELAARFPAVKF